MVRWGVGVRAKVKNVSMLRASVGPEAGLWLGVEVEEAGRSNQGAL